MPAAIAVAAFAAATALWTPTLSDATAVPGAVPAATSSAAGATRGATGPPAATMTPSATPSATPPARPSAGRLTTPVPAPAPRALTWSDDFNRGAGAPVDRGRWNFDVGSHGWGNEQLEYYTDSTRNAVHDGQGHLVVTVRKENPGGYVCPYGACRYTSARMVTNGTFAQRYGRFEARMKIPRGQGIWPAFWMLGDDFDEVGWPASGEIDVMENVGKEAGTVWATAHGPGYSGAEGITKGKKIAEPLANDFHTYAVEWSPGLIVWYLDGVAYHRVTPADLDGDAWVFDKPYHLLLNVAVGGAWPGPPDASTVFPQEMLVD
jgi:beta-glucanase (GH16 family)